MKYVVYLFVAVGFIQSATAKEYRLGPEHWAFQGQVTDIVTYEGERALHLHNGIARLKGVKLKDGVIGFDIAFSRQRSFAGLLFRRINKRNGEFFYFRPHQSGNPDANQYTPFFNGSSAWQIYYGPQYSAPTTYRFGEWMHVEIRIKGDRAEVHLDGQPILHITDLLNVNRAGDIVLRSFLGEDIYFANVSVRPGDDVVFDGKAAPPPAMPAGTVKSWQVSEPLAGASLDGVSALAGSDIERLNWQSVDVEANGIANLARTALHSGDRDTVLARLVLESGAEQLARIRFGYSDSVRVYVNSRLVYSGDNTYRSRDYRYLGTVGLFDAVHAPLQVGRNEIVFAVTESFGGWAVAAAFDREGSIEVVRP